MSASNAGVDTSDPEILGIFIEESSEALGRCESLLLEAESGGDLTPDKMATMFRDFHTLKGTASFLALPNITRLAHAGEDLMARLRDRTLAPRREHFSTLLDVVDRLRALTALARDTGRDDGVEVEALIVRVRAWMTEVPEAPARAAPPPVVQAPPPPPPAARVEIEALKRLAELLVEKGVLSDGQMRDALGEPRKSEPEVRAADVVAAPRRGVDPSDGTVRVNVNLLDRLMSLMEELVLVRNQLVQYARSTVDPVAQAAIQRLGIVTSDLQEQVMKTRMQPVSRVFEKIPRLVRDLCDATGKQVTCHVDDHATEIDKAIVEAIRDPVLHIIRNSVDHGVEAPEARRAAGKDVAGRLSVSAAHEGGMVCIEIEDDGGGIDPARMRKHAVNRGVITAAEADRMSDREAVELVFRPGFSTASKVTNISGRGVGMDVVRTQIERAGGQVEIDSAVGRGTTIRLKLPLTLAIIPALLVRACGQRFAIPQVNLLELVYLDEEQSRRGVERVREAEIYRLRGEVLPLVRLDDVLRRPSAARATDTHIVVMSVGSCRYGLVVDHVDDTEEIVIKALHGPLKGLTSYAGATVLGDGSVALILDVAGIAALAGIDVASRRRAERREEPRRGAGRESLVIFNAGDGAQCAVSLSVVARLEEIPRNSIERVAGQEVVQYRGEIVPVVRPERLLPIGEPDAEGDTQRLVVFNVLPRVSMAVESIVDIVEIDDDAVRADHAQACTRGCVVVHGRTTPVLDVKALLASARPGVQYHDAA